MQNKSKKSVYILILVAGAAVFGLFLLTDYYPWKYDNRRFTAQEAWSIQRKPRWVNEGRKQHPDSNAPFVSQSETPERNNRQDADPPTSKEEYKAILERRPAYMDAILAGLLSDMKLSASGYYVGGQPEPLELDQAQISRLDAGLAEFLQDPSQEVRASAVMVVQFFIDPAPQLAEHVWTALDDSHQEVRRCAAGLLLQLPTVPADAPRYIALLEREDANILSFTTRKMQEWGSGKRDAETLRYEQLLPAVPNLRKLRDHSDELVKIRARWLLTHLNQIPPQVDIQS